MSTFLWYAPAVLTALIFVLAPALARLHVVAPLPGLVAFLSSVVPGTVALIVGIVLLVLGQRTGGLISATIGVLPLFFIVLSLLMARPYPAINDISTNLDNPPVFVAAITAPDNQGKSLAYPEDFKEAVETSYPGLISLQVDRPAEETFRLVRQIAEHQAGWRVTRIDEATLTLEGSETKGIFQFTDDFIIRVQPMEGSSQIDMRSRSRVGKGDFGANAHRIRDFFAEVAKETGTARP